MATPSTLALQSITPTVIVAAKIGVTTDSAVYTVPAGRAIKVAQATVCNTSGAPCTVGVAIHTAAGGAGKVVPDAYSLPAGQVLPLGDFIKEHLMGEGDAIFVHAGAPNALEVVISAAVMA